MAGKEGDVNPNKEWEEKNIISGEDQPIEISPDQWRFENRINDIPEEKWNKNPQEAYNDAVVGDLDE